MRKVREVLRLLWGQGRSVHEVARACALARSTVGEYVRRARKAGLSWPLPEDVDDGALEARLFPPLPRVGGGGVRPLPDWDEVDRELKRDKRVTLQLLWEEYREAHPDGYQYSRYCDHFRAWRRQQEVVMRQPHRAGEKLFVDYAGQRAQVVDPATGEVREAEVFVAVLGASSYAYCEASWSQTLPDWIGSHVRALAFFGGCPEVLVPDNLKAAVTKAHLYEPDLNPTYLEFAQALRARGDPRAKRASEGQGEGGVGRSAGGDVDLGAAAQAHVLRAGGAERRHRRVAGGVQRPGVPAAAG